MIPGGIVARVIHWPTRLGQFSRWLRRLGCAIAVLGLFGTAITANTAGASTDATSTASTPTTSTPTTPEGATCNPPAAAPVPIIRPGLQGESSIQEQILTELAKYALKKGGDSALGWVTEAVFGHQETDTERIQKQIAEVNRQLTDLNSKVDQLQKQLEEFKNAVFDKLEQTTYDDLAAQVQGQIATITSLERRFDAFVIHRPVGSALDGDAIDTLNEIRTQMPKVIDEIQLRMVTPGSKGLISYFDSLTWRHQPFYKQGLSLEGQIYTSDYLDPAYTQLDQYQGYLIRALYLLAEAYHFSYQDGPKTHPAQPAFVECEAQVVQEDVASERLLAAHGILPIPKNTLVDARTGLMWSRSSVDLPGQAHPPYYCWTNDKTWLFPDGFCLWYDRPAQQPSPPTAPVPTLVASLTYAGLQGWRLPTEADFRSLLQSSRGNLRTWGLAQGINGFVEERYPGYGPHTIEPILYERPQGGTVHLNNPSDGAMSFGGNGCQFPEPPPLGCLQLAGRVLVIQQYFVGGA